MATYYTRGQLARLAKVSRQRISVLIRDGKLVPTDYDADGAPLFSVLAVTAIMSERWNTMQESDE